MVVTAKIEIVASPKEVREVFLDFKQWHKMKADLIKDVKRREGAEGEVKVREVLDADFGILSPVTVLENTPSQFVWKGAMFVVMGGEHTFQFEPSTTTPGGTTFTHFEVPVMLSILIMKLVPATAMFQKFCEDFKAHVESTVASRKGSV